MGILSNITGAIKTRQFLIEYLERKDHTTEELMTDASVIEVFNDIRRQGNSMWPSTIMHAFCKFRGDDAAYWMPILIGEMIHLKYTTPAFFVVGSARGHHGGHAQRLLRCMGTAIEQVETIQYKDLHFLLEQTYGDAKYAETNLCKHFRMYYIDLLKKCRIQDIDEWHSLFYKRSTDNIKNKLTRTTIINRMYGD